MSDELPSFIGISVPSPQPKKTKYSKEERKHHCESWKKSGLSMREYCNRVGLTISTLCQWIKKMNAIPTNEINVGSENTLHNLRPTKIEIILVSGVRVRFSETIHPGKIIKLIQVLGLCN
jgi:hypothetical protein